MVQRKTTMRRDSFVPMSRAKARDCARLLSRLMEDVFAGHALLQLFNEGTCNQCGTRLGLMVQPQYRTLLQRMVFFHLTTALHKLAEFQASYSRHLPLECRLWMKDFRREVHRRGFDALRNGLVAHIHERKTRAPLTQRRIDELFRQAFGRSSAEFYDWIRNPKDAGDLHTVMGRVRWLRDEIVRAYELHS